MDICKQGTVKEYTRSLVEKAIIGITETRKEKIEIFSLPADTFVLESRMIQHLRQQNIPCHFYCAEADSKVYKRAEEKISLHTILSRHVSLEKATDHDIYRALEVSNSPQLFDAAWHDWCGYLNNDKVSTFIRSCQRLRFPNFIAITLMARREHQEGTELLQKFGRFFHSDRREVIIPLLLNFKLKLNGFSILPINAVKYRTCFSGKTSTTMLFYLFSVFKRDIHTTRSEQMKIWIDRNLKDIVSYEGKLWFPVKGEINGSNIL